MQYVNPKRPQDYSEVRMAETVANVGVGTRAVVAHVRGISNGTQVDPGSVEIHACSGVVLASTNLRTGNAPPRNRVSYHDRVVQHGEMPVVFSKPGTVGFVRTVSVMEGTRDGLVISRPLSLSVVELKPGALVSNVNKAGAAGRVAARNGFDSVNTMFQVAGSEVELNIDWVKQDPDADEIGRVLADLAQQFGEGFDEVQLEPTLLEMAMLR